MVFRLSSTDFNDPIQSTAGLVANDPNGSPSFNASGTSFNGRGGGANRTDRPGGVTFTVLPLGENGLFYHDFCQLSVLRNAMTPHTAFQVDVEVFYDLDADDTRRSAGQYATSPV